MRLRSFVKTAGEWVVEQARFRTQVESQEGGEGRVREGNYMILWRYGESAGWLIERYIEHTGFELDSD